MIETKNLIKKYTGGDRDIYAVNNISLKVEPREFLAIVGRSGSGKSTLMYQMGLLDRPSGGAVFVDGVDTSTLTDSERTHMRLTDLGYVFQDYANLPSFTALENVMLPLLMMGISKIEASERALRALERVGLGDRVNNLPSELSGGQQQRISIARAIGHDPKILFADEPTANLDTETSRMILDVFLDLHRSGQTIVMVTHEEEYAALADRLIELSDGKIIKEQNRTP